MRLLLVMSVLTVSVFYAVTEFVATRYSLFFRCYENSSFCDTVSITINGVHFNDVMSLAYRDGRPCIHKLGVFYSFSDTVELVVSGTEYQLAILESDSFDIVFINQGVNIKGDTAKYFRTYNNCIDYLPNNEGW